MPAITLSRVIFPIPFGPTTPIFCAWVYADGDVKDDLFADSLVSLEYLIDKLCHVPSLRGCQTGHHITILMKYCEDSTAEEAGRRRAGAPRGVQMRDARRAGAVARKTNIPCKIICSKAHTLHQNLYILQIIDLGVLPALSRLSDIGV